MNAPSLTHQTTLYSPKPALNSAKLAVVTFDRDLTDGSVVR